MHCDAGKSLHRRQTAGRLLPAGALRYLGQGIGQVRWPQSSQRRSSDEMFCVDVCDAHGSQCDVSGGGSAAALSHYPVAAHLAQFQRRGVCPAAPTDARSHHGLGTEDEGLLHRDPAGTRSPTHYQDNLRHRRGHHARHTDDGYVIRRPLRTDHQSWLAVRKNDPLGVSIRATD